MATYPRGPLVSRRGLRCFWMARGLTAAWRRDLLPGRLTQREIGEVLHLSMNTVKTHTRNIFRKLSVSSRDEAVEVARLIGLL